MKILTKNVMAAGSLFAITLLCLTVLGLAKPGRASANYSTDLNCTDSSTEFNVVVVARVFDYYGNLKGYANNYTFHVSAYEKHLAYRDKNSAGNWKPWVYYDSRSGDMGYPSGHQQYSNETIEWQKMKSESIRLWNNGYYSHTGVNGDFAVQMDSNYVNGALSGSGMAPGKGNACAVGSTMAPAYAFRDGDNTHHVTLTTANSYGSAANYPSKVWVGTEALGHDGNNQSWSLSCLGQNDGSSPIKNMYFGFWPTWWDGSYVTNAQSYTSRAAAAGGGWWSPGVELWAANATSAYVYFDYHEPAPPTPPTMTPQANLNNTDPAADAANYIEPGGSFTASGQVSASASTYGGSVNATWRVWYDTDQTYSGEPTIGGGTTNLTFSAAGGTQYVGSMGPTTIPLPNGDIYSYICSQVVINSTSGSPAPLGVGAKSTKCIPIERRPFFQAVGGDVNASAVFPDPVNGNCATTVPVGKGLIAGWNRGSTGSYNGAGTNIAAFAAQAIADFVSYRPGAPPKGLTFASTGTYGGSFDQVYCMDKITVYDAGDVFVTPNSGLNTYNGNITTTGNIKISHNVTTINGVFITKGKIYTCADDSGNAATSGTMKSLCSSTLTVNGAFVADIIYLLRINGSLSSNIPAEVFNYGPNTWLPSIAAPSGGGAGSINLGDADSETSLPPVL